MSQDSKQSTEGGMMSKTSKILLLGIIIGMGFSALAGIASLREMASLLWHFILLVISGCVLTLLLFYFFGQEEDERKEPQKQQNHPVKGRMSRIGKHNDECN
jgi:hypothetical protein